MPVNNGFNVVNLSLVYINGHNFNGWSIAKEAKL
jgi:hypothetical protein